MNHTKIADEYVAMTSANPNRIRKSKLERQPKGFAIRSEQKSGTYKTIGKDFGSEQSQETTKSLMQHIYITFHVPTDATTGYEPKLTRILDSGSVTYTVLIYERSKCDV